MGLALVEVMANVVARTVKEIKEDEKCIFGVVELDMFEVCSFFYAENTS